MLRGMRIFSLAILSSYDADNGRINIHIYVDGYNRTQIANLDKEERS